MPGSDSREAAAAIIVAEFVEHVNLLEVPPFIAEEPLALMGGNSLKRAGYSELLVAVSTTNWIAHFAW